MKPRGLFGTVPLGVLLGVLAVHEARAQVEDRAGAERLFEEGRQLADSGKLQEACAKFEASERLEAAVGTLLNLGDCYERRGKLATAWSTFRAASSLALAKADPGRADFATKRAEALAPRLTTLTISVAAHEPGMIVKRDGAIVEEGAWGSPLPVDAGTHVVEVSAPGKRGWSETVEITGEGRAAVVRVDALVPEVQSSPARTEAAAVPPTASPNDGSMLRVLGFTGLGLGALGFGMGTFFALRARSTWSDARAHCDANAVCDPTGYDMNHSARAEGNVATVSFALGAAFVGAGLAAILLAPRSRPTAPAPSLTLVPHSTGVRLSVLVRY